MDSLKCRMQILEEQLTSGNYHEIEDEKFKKVKEAYDNALKLLWIEEKFNIVSANFYEWEEEIKKSYDFLISRQNSDAECDEDMRKHGNKEIIILNRRFLNVLSSIRMYRDQVAHDLSGMSGKLKEAFEDETHLQYDKTFSYQIMELLRNYMQHQGLVIERIVAIIPFSRNLGDELWYYAESNYTSIKCDSKFNAKITCLPERNEEMKWINLIPMLREYYGQIATLHNRFREITESILISSIACIEECLNEVYGNIPVACVAFFGKEQNDTFRDFLLQATYIQRLKSYRKSIANIDTTRYYLSKKSILESDCIRVSNSAKCQFRYNT